MKKKKKRNKKNITNTTNTANITNEPATLKEDNADNDYVLRDEDKEFINIFFSKTKCDQCGQELNGKRSLSTISDKCLCRNCKDAEHTNIKHKKFIDVNTKNVISQTP